MQIAVVNHSTRVSDQDVSTMTAAIQIQMTEHLSKQWNGSPVITFYPNIADAPPNDWMLSIIDTPDVADALGYHTVENNGTIDGFIFASPVLDNGGVVLAGSDPNTISVASVFSHEACELYCDPLCQTYKRGPTIPQGSWYSMEVADPVQDCGYFISVNGANVSVSNFVFPTYFDPNAKNEQLDYLSKLTTPFQISAGGYCVVVNSEGQASQILE